MWRVFAYVFNKQLRTSGKGWSSSLGFERVANSASLKNVNVTKHLTRPRMWTDLLALVRIILKWIFKMWDGEVWTGFDLFHDGDRWRLLLIAVMNLRGIS